MDTRRKRIDFNGEWEYECASCKLWLPKNKFKGCVDKIDAYGNCLSCRSCISREANKTKLTNEQKEVNEILISMGYDLDSDIPVHIQFKNKHNLK